MRYMIWGAGGTAKHFLMRHMNEYFFRNPIVAFVDNDKKKEGKIFAGERVKIISPSEIREYDFDVILICCKDEKSVIRQIRNQLQLQTPIQTMREICAVMYQLYHDKMKIYDKKILMIGDLRYRESNLARTYMFRKIEYSDSSQIENIGDASFDYILCPQIHECLDLSISKNYRGAETEREWIDKLVATGKVERKKILTFSVVWIYANVDREYSLGEENPDKKILLIKPAGINTGLGGVVIGALRNIEYAKRNHMIPVIDMESQKNNYITDDEVGKVNGWEKFFLQPAGCHVKDIQRSRNIVESSRSRFGTEAIDLRENLRLQPGLEKEIEEYCSKYFKDENKILGVLVRGSDYVNMKPFGHAIQPDLDMVMEAVDRKYSSRKYDLIYVCTEEEQILTLFCEKFHDKVFYHPAARVKGKENGYLAQSSLYKDNDPYRVGADYWIALCALSRCNALVAGNCGGTQVALMLNQNQYEDVYIFQLGQYGIEDTEV